MGDAEYHVQAGAEERSQRERSYLAQAPSQVGRHARLQIAASGVEMGRR